MIVARAATYPLMRGGALVACVLLAACGAPASNGNGSAPQAGRAPGASAPLAERWEYRVVTIGVAERIADACYGQGISMAPSPWTGAVNRATEELAASGADRAALNAVYTAHDFNNSSAQAEAYLAARGAVPGQPETLCPVGEAEIAQGSDVGQLLQKL